MKFTGDQANRSEASAGDQLAVAGGAYRLRPVAKQAGEFEEIWCSRFVGLRVQPHTGPREAATKKRATGTAALNKRFREASEALRSDFLELVG
jgi:hypothetical protein